MIATVHDPPTNGISARLDEAKAFVAGVNVAVSVGLPGLVSTTSAWLPPPGAPSLPDSRANDVVALVAHRDGS